MELKEIVCEECDGTGVVEWSENFEDWEEEECDCCGGSGILRVPLDEEGENI